MLSTGSSSFGLGYAPQVWLFSDFDAYNQIRPVGYPAYLSPAQQARLERIRQARLLHDGRHWRLFLYEGRTQFDFPEVSVNGTLKRLYCPYNMCQVVSLVSAGLLFGESPNFTAENPLQEQKLADLIERTAFHRLLYHTAIEASCDGEAYLESIVTDGRVYARRIDAADIFPEGAIQPDGQYRSYVKYLAKNVGTEDNQDWRLLVTRYLPGRIERTVKALDQQGFIRPRVLTTNEWPQEDPEEDAIEPVTPTGISANTITFVPNRMVRDLCVSDYDGIVEDQDKLNAKETQLARVLGKHSDPKLAAPVSMANKGDMPGGGGYDVYFFHDKSEIPQYITWNAEIESAMKERDGARSAILLKTQTSPLLMGLREGASSAHNAYKSVKIEATPSLNRARDKGLIWRPAVVRVLNVCQQLEQTLPGERYDMGTISVELQDGIPVDAESQANEIAAYRGAGVMSVARAVELQISDPARRDQELDDLADEAAKTTPSVLMGEPGQQEPAPNAGADKTEAQEEEQTEVEVAA